MSSLRPQHDTTDQGLKTRNLLPRRPEAGRLRSGVSTARSLVRALFPETAVSPVSSRGREKALPPPPKAPPPNALPSGLGLQRRKLGGRHSVHCRPHQSSPSFGPITCSLPKTLSCARGWSLCPPLWGWTLPSTSALRTGRGTPVQVCWGCGREAPPWAERSAAVRGGTQEAPGCHSHGCCSLRAPSILPRPGRPGACSGPKLQAVVTQAPGSEQGSLPAPAGGGSCSPATPEAPVPAPPSPGSLPAS